MFEAWYGKGFIEINHPQRGSAFVKMDGNRRISIWKEDDQRVRASFTDVPVEKIVEAQLAEMEKEKEGEK